MMVKGFRLKVFVLMTAIALLVAGCGVDKPEEVSKAEENLPEVIDFNYHIKPILSDRCYACHGPDKNKQKANLRLDVADSAYAALSSGKGVAIKPGSLKKSQVYHRMISENPDEIMPPPNSNLTLTPEEIAYIARWIEQGAEYKPHWAFIKPEKAEIPSTKNQQWAKTPIDQFVLKKLEREGLSPAEEADKERFIRRLSFDLTGLPPTIEEINNFLSDKSESAYEKLVDRLLSSDAYGERMAMEWMDVSRYADSHGYHADGIRTMWPWRDWVIKAFNENMPYDQFVKMQLAGDLMPKATREHKLATAFNRNHPMTAEGGVIDEEFRLEYVFDRTNTTAKAFMGLTFECARCHDHKFDPIEQKSYYQMASFFNNVNELGMNGDDGNTGPMMLLPDDEVEKILGFVQKEIKERSEELVKKTEEVEANITSNDLRKYRHVVPKGMIAHYPLDKVVNGKIDNKAASKIPGTASNKPSVVTGKVGGAVLFDNEYKNLYLEHVGLFERTESFSIGLWVSPQKSGLRQTILGNAGDKNSFWKGHDLELDTMNQINVRLIHALPHNYIHVRSKEPLPINQWTHVAFTYDGSSDASGIKIYVNGKKAETTTEHNRLYRTIIPYITPKYAPDYIPIRVGRSNRAYSGDYGIFTGKLDEIKVFDRALTGLEVGKLAGLDLMKDMLSTPESDWTENQKHLASEYYLDRYNTDYKETRSELEALRLQEQDLLNKVIEVMVMDEMETPRITHVLDRGVYDAPKEEVQSVMPDNILHYEEKLPRNRLGLADWLMDKDNPLTSRVMVNRFWQMYFGRGIVSTVDDFGNQGTLPTHPELLDWLAVHFQETNWDIKAMQKLIVTSAVYKQSSVMSDALREKDPDNLLLSVGPQNRLQAEMIRDNALAASGLLVKKVGGKSVKPYQPPGLWKEISNFSNAYLEYKPDEGDDLYRRSLYTLIRRSSPPPSMTVFDAPDRNMCIVKREKTSTPLQALVLLNDPQFVEAARLLAERMQKEGGTDIQEQIIFAFKLLTSRSPKAEEIDVFKQLYEDEKLKYQQDPKGAGELLTVGSYPVDDSLDKTETAALTMVANVMMSHDDASMKR